MHHKKYDEKPLKKILFPDGSMIIETGGAFIIVEAQVQYGFSPLIQMKYCLFSKN